MEIKLNNRLRIFRYETRILQRQLAEIVESNRLTIHKIEEKKFNPSSFLALKIAKHFKVSVDDIFWLEREDSAFDLNEEQPHRDSII